MSEENQKNDGAKIIGIVILTFLISFLAFYIVMEIMLYRMTSPIYQAKRIEKIIDKEKKELERFEDKILNNPFEPKMRPMIVNLVKEPSEYHIIVDLKPLDGDENAVVIKSEENTLTISGELEKKSHGNEKIINFSQSYYLDDKLDLSKMSKEKKGDKYIITIPYGD